MTTAPGQGMKHLRMLGIWLSGLGEKRFRVSGLHLGMLTSKEGTLPTLPKTKMESADGGYGRLSSFKGLCGDSCHFGVGYDVWLLEFWWSFFESCYPKEYKHVSTKQ